MVLSNTQEASGERPTTSTVDVMAFLKEFKPLECSCCEEVIGFKHRSTGALMCKKTVCREDSVSVKDNKDISEVVPAASKAQHGIGAVVKEEEKPVNSVGRGQGEGSVASDKNKSSNLTAAQSSAPKIASKPEVRAAPRVVPSSRTSAPLDDETSYKHVSTVHKYEAPKESPPKPSFDTVDNKIAPQKTTLKPSVNQTDDGVKKEETIRSDVNPFFKKFPSSKEMVPPQVTAKAAMINRPANEPEVETIAPSVPKVDAPQKKATTPPREPTRPAPPKIKSAPAVAVLQKPKYSWLDCNFSEQLVSGADVKVAFVWGMNKYQVQAVPDEEPILVFQDRLRAFVNTSKPMTRKPVKDEVVIGIYEEEYYRARVLKVRTEGCQLVFIDFGDSSFNKFEDMYELNDDLMEYPISSVTVTLSGLPEDCSHIKATKNVNDIVFGVLTLDLGNKPLKPTEAESYEGKLWVDDTMTLNKLVKNILDGK